MTPNTDTVIIRPLASANEAEECARLMASTDPWVTLGRNRDACLAMINDASREIYVARDESGVAGCLVLCMTGAFVGYIQAVLVAPDRRGQGVGTQLLAFAEARVFSVSPNIFLCVSSFNTSARRLYERLGYRYVGELTDYLVSGYSELLFRKTRGPWATFARAANSRPE